MDIFLPENVKKIFELLQSNGFECFLVGGCVRDSLLNIKPHDWDFATDATPKQIVEVFCNYNTVDIGKRFGTITVVMDNKSYEITTYRSDGEYEDSRHPTDVCFSKELRDDLIRRDFTINALAFSPQTGIIDLFYGKNDIDNKVIRCVNDADLRFREDALRILRALRFSSTYGFCIEQNTSNAIFRNMERLNNISNERIASEFLDILCKKNACSVLTDYKEVFSVFVPEIRVMFGYNQNNPNHDKDLYNHTVSAVGNIESDRLLRTVMFFHDIGKPSAMTLDENGISHYACHQMKSAEISKEILKRLKLPSAFVNDALILIEYHDYPVVCEQSAVKRLLNKIGKENTLRLMKVKRADILAQSEYNREKKLSALDDYEIILQRVIDDGQCFSKKDLKINGNDILSIDNIDGVLVGKTINMLLNLVIDGQIDNDREQLISKAKEIINALDIS